MKLTLLTELIPHASYSSGLTSSDFYLSKHKEMAR